MNRTSCRFNFVKKSLTYFTGETVEGTVNIRSTTFEDVRSIYLYFEGETRVRWQKNIGRLRGSVRNITQVFEGTHTFLTRSYELYRSTDGPLIYDFRIPLPDICETSCNLKYGTNSYEVSVIIQRDGDRSQIFTQKICVIQHYDLNLYADQLLIPCTENSDVTCCLSCRRDFIKWNAKVLYGGYIPGQDITYIVEIDNGSRCKNIDGFVASLHQVYRFTSQNPPGHTTLLCTVVTQRTHEETILHSTKRVIEGSLTVPSLPPSRKTASLIQLTYHVFFTLRPPYGKKDSLIEIIIEIGTIPLIRSIPLPNEYFELSTESPRNLRQIKPPTLEECIITEPFEDVDDVDNADIVKEIQNANFVHKFPLFPNISAPNSNPDTPNIPLYKQPSASAPSYLSEASPRFKYGLSRMPCPPSDELESPISEEPVTSTTVAIISSRCINKSKPPPLKFESPILEEVTTGIKYINIDRQEHIRNDPMDSSSETTTVSVHTPAIRLLKKLTVPSTSLPEVSTKTKPPTLEEASMSTKVINIDRIDPMTTSCDVRSPSTETFKTPLLEYPPALKASTSAATTSTDSINDNSAPPPPTNEPPTLEEASSRTKVVNIDRNVPMNISSDVRSPSTDTFKTPLLEDPPRPPPFLRKDSSSAPTISTDSNNEHSALLPLTNEPPTLEEASGSTKVLNIDRNVPMSTSSDVRSPSTETFKTPLLEYLPGPSPSNFKTTSSAVTISTDSNNEDSEPLSSINEDSTIGIKVDNIERNEPTDTSSEMHTTSTDIFKTPSLGVLSPSLSEESSSAPTISTDNINDSEPLMPNYGSSISEETTSGAQAIDRNDPVSRSLEERSPSTEIYKTPLLEVPPAVADKTSDNSDDSES